MNSSFTQLIHHEHPAHGSVEDSLRGRTTSQTETASHGCAGSDSVLVSTVSDVPRALWVLWEFSVPVDFEGRKGVFWDAGRVGVALLCSGAARSSAGEEETVGSPTVPLAVLISTPHTFFFFFFSFSPFFFSHSLPSQLSP